MGNRVLAIVGATATGKSALALRLAARLGGEIVNADSRQVYRYMDIGTGKPSPEERMAVPHHLLDVVDPDGDYHLALFLRQARAAIAAIEGRGKIPMVVGGTGQYVWALLEGWQVPEVPPDPELRARLEARGGDEGSEALHRELAAVAPARAAAIDPRNVRRVIRALEVLAASGGSTAGRGRDPGQAFQAAVVGLTVCRAQLYARIDRRVEAMVAAGWPDEVRALLDRGYDPDLPALTGLGYRELGRYVRGLVSLDDAVRRTRSRTHRFARAQHAWFRLDDPRLTWLDASDGTQTALESLAEAAFLGR